MAEPEFFAASTMQPRPARPIGRTILGPARDPIAPAFFEWMLQGQEWSDEHPHDEYVYVLEGELHVTVDESSVVAATGSLVRVPAHSRGRYAAPEFARMLSVYGPRPSEPSDARGVLRSLR